MSRSNKTKRSKPRSGMAADERTIDHRRHRARIKREMARDPESVENQEAFHEQGDRWNWD